VSDTRERLIDAATELLDEGGPSAVTLREVGRRANVSHNAPYKHFADKQDLLAAVAARELRRRVDDRAPAGAKTAAIESILVAYVRWAIRHPARFKLTFGTWTTDSAELADAAAAAREALVDAVSAAQHDGQLPDGDPERIAALVQAVAHGAADLVRDVLRALNVRAQR
jgi:AcrR family transcriptional regulator